MNKLSYLLSCCAADFPHTPVTIDSRITYDDEGSDEEVPDHAPAIRFKTAIKAMLAMPPENLLRCIADISEVEFQAIQAKFPTPLAAKTRGAFELYDALLTSVCGSSPAETLTTKAVWQALLEGHWRGQKNYTTTANALLQAGKRPSHAPIFVFTLREIVTAYHRQRKLSCLPSKTTSSNMKVLLAIEADTRRFDDFDTIPDTLHATLCKIPWKRKKESHSASHRAQRHLLFKLSWQGYFASVNMAPATAPQAAKFLLEKLKQQDIVFCSTYEFNPFIRSGFFLVTAQMSQLLAKQRKLIPIILPKLCSTVASIPNPHRTDALKKLFSDKLLWALCSNSTRQTCILRLLFQCQDNTDCVTTLLKQAGHYLDTSSYQLYEHYVKKHYGVEVAKHFLDEENKTLRARINGYRLIAGIDEFSLCAFSFNDDTFATHGTAYESSTAMMADLISQYEAPSEHHPWLPAAQTYLDSIACPDDQLFELLQQNKIISIPALGWKLHAISMSIFCFGSHYYLAFANRNSSGAEENGLTIYHINEPGVLMDHKSFCKIITLVREENIKVLNLTDYPESPLATQLRLREIYHHKKSKQKIDSCVPISIHNNLLTHLMFHSLIRRETIDELAIVSQIKDALMACHATYKAFRGFTRNESIIKMLETIIRFHQCINYPKRLVECLAIHGEKLTDQTRIEISRVHKCLIALYKPAPTTTRLGRSPLVGTTFIHRTLSLDSHSSASELSQDSELESKPAPRDDLKPVILHAHGRRFAVV